MTPQFYNKNKDLSMYGFMCGYVQEKKKGERYKRIFMEHQHFHIQSGINGQRCQVWETFEKNELTKARSVFNNIKIN